VKRQLRGRRCPRNGKSSNESECHCATAWEGDSVRESPLTSPYTDLHRDHDSDKCTAGARRWSDVETTPSHGEPRRLLAVRREATLLVVAVQFLTRFPVPSIPVYEAAWLVQSVRYFPLVGVLIGTVNVLIWRLAGHWLPPTLAVGLMLAASLLVTGAFHEDGFADSCDGFGGGMTPQRVLDIMQDSRIGAYGAIGIVMMLGLKWSGLVALPQTALPCMVVGAHMVSRWCATGLMWRLPYARIEGDAKSRAFAGGLSARAWGASGVIGVLAFAVLMVLPQFSPDAQTLHALIVAVFAAMGTAAAAAAYCRRRIGGYTGDCLGAVQQLSELSFLLVGVAILNPVRQPA
jgi:adenosylcobinamide-GDP ribazoletransferase